MWSVQTANILNGLNLTKAKIAKILNSKLLNKGTKEVKKSA